MAVPPDATICSALADSRAALISTPPEITISVPPRVGLSVPLIAVPPARTMPLWPLLSV